MAALPAIMRRRRFALAAVAATAVLAAAAILETVLLVLAGGRDDPGRADLALVLGSKVERDGTPSPRLRARLDTALAWYRAGDFPDIVASGGTGVEGFDEAVVMRDYLVARGVPAAHVIVDGGGATTFASARNTAAIVRERGLRSVFVVSQGFHVPRARLALRRFGVPVVYSAHAPFFEWRDLYSAPRELAGYAAYLFRCYDVPAAPAAPPGHTS